MNLSFLVPYLFPVLLIGSTVFLAVKEYRENRECIEPVSMVKKIRRGTGLFVMLLTSFFMTVGIYRLQAGVLDIPWWIAVGLSLVFIMFIGIWDIGHEMNRLKKKLAKTCEDDYQLLLKEIDKAEKKHKQKSALKPKSQNAVTGKIKKKNALGKKDASGSAEQEACL